MIKATIQQDNPILKAVINQNNSVIFGKIIQNENSINNKNNIKDISEMNPLDMINQVITTSSNVFSELQMNSNTIKN